MKIIRQKKTFFPSQKHNKLCTSGEFLVKGAALCKIIFLFVLFRAAHHVVMLFPHQPRTGGSLKALLEIRSFTQFWGSIWFSPPTQRWPHQRQTQKEIFRGASKNVEPAHAGPSEGKRQGKLLLLLRCEQTARWFMLCFLWQCLLFWQKYIIDNKTTLLLFLLLPIE